MSDGPIPAGTTSEQSSPVHARNALNDLNAREWLSESVSVWTQRGLGAGHAETSIERLHPAPFSYSDVSRLIRLFTKPGMTVLDPFVGVGSTLKAAALDGRNGIGFELYPTFADLATERLRTELPTEALVRTSQVVWEGDARILAPKLDAESIDFIVTSPPYWGILNKKADHKAKGRVEEGLQTNYGADSRDLANIADYGQFVGELGDTLQACGRALKPRKYIAIIVGDFRHGSRYYMFHADLARAMENRGYELQALNVLYQRHKRVFPYGYPYAYVPNVHHQNIVILRKSK